MSVEMFLPCSRILLCSQVDDPKNEAALNVRCKKSPKNLEIQLLSQFKITTFHLNTTVLQLMTCLEPNMNSQNHWQEKRNINHLLLEGIVSICRKNNNGPAAVRNLQLGSTNETTTQQLQTCKYMSDKYSQLPRSVTVGQSKPILPIAKMKMKPAPTRTTATRLGTTSSFEAMISPVYTF
ncbi:hypothetical protein M8C21_007782 [Ambrosia artemisiifolia]|uniref:Uncharacterized protein n=1 Tax=Ambrosia artemisiifolia TaxID=4212 RepID=A0AAD5G5A5_AMBAR|nr:hypothetical protein M8C21_007782 [Ambrosia artemisiifolia]